MAAQRDFLLNHPDLLRAALLDHENLRRCVHRPLRRVLGTGLLTCRSERHKKQRCLLQPMFSRNRIVPLAELMVGQTAFATGAPAQTIAKRAHRLKDARSDTDISQW
jgi:cytochrome P450